MPPLLTWMSQYEGGQSIACNLPCIKLFSLSGKEEGSY